MALAYAVGPFAPPTLEVAVTSEEPYLSVEEVARHLHLPASMLARRAEAGDIPSQRIETDSGVLYRLRLSDLGLDPGLATIAEAAPEAETATGVIELELEGVAQAVPSSGTLPSPRRVAAHADVHGEISAMTLDPRELVSGLLDRWERTLEQRIYAEQRRRFEAELTARQTRIRELQMELQVVRAENAATQADKDRIIADREHDIAGLQQSLAEPRRAPAGGRRLWPFGRR